MSQMIRETQLHIALIVKSSYLIAHCIFVKMTLDIGKPMELPEISKETWGMYIIKLSITDQKYWY